MPRVDETISYVGWGSRTRTVRCDIELGLGVRRRGGRLSSLVWVASMGFVSGFRKRDIVYYLLTRELSERIWRRVMAWEQRTGRFADRKWAGGTWAHRHQHLSPMTAAHRTAVEYRTGYPYDTDVRPPINEFEATDLRPYLDQLDAEVRRLTEPNGSDGG